MGATAPASRRCCGSRRPARADPRTVARAGRVALLLQNPGDYSLHDRDRRRPSRGAGRALADRHPRDVSGGERQRLALALVLPRRAARRSSASTSRRAAWTAATAPALAARLRELAAGGTAVLVATHDAEFAARAGRPRRPARRRPAGRRRADRRGARRRLVLRHPDRARAGRRGGAAARGRRRAAARARLTTEVGRVSWVAASFLLLGSRSPPASPGTSGRTRPRA